MSSSSTDAGRRIFYQTCIVILTLTGAYLIYRLNSIVVVLFAAIIFASAIRPLVLFLARFRIPKIVSIVLVYIIVLGSFVALLTAAIPPLIGLTTDLFSENALVRMIQDTLESGVNFLVSQNILNEGRDVALSPEFRSFFTNIDDALLADALPYTRNALFVLSQLLLALVMSFYWITSREKIQDLLLNLSPLHHRTRINDIWNDIETNLGAYVRGQLLLSVVVGVGGYIGLRLFDVPYALALAIISALAELIPVVGPFIGAVPAIVVAFTVAPSTGVFVSLWYLVMQQLEGNVLVPKVMERSIGMNPLLVIIALIAGASLNGVVGALFALPVAGALQVVARHIWLQPVIDAEPQRIDGGVLLTIDEQNDEIDDEPTVIVQRTIVS